MKKEFLMIALVALAAVSCDKNGPVIEEGQDAVKIDPVITRATSTNFEEGDQIGLTITKGDKDFAANACLTYSEADKSFAGTQKWYAEGGEACTLKAFYPYQAAGFPETFTVASDQSKGAGSSDFMVATKTNVYPQRQAVSMVFKHYLSQIVIAIDNKADAEISSVVLKEIIPTATIAVEDDAIAVSADASAAKSDVKAEPLEANRKFRAIVAPQTIEFALEIAIKSGAVLVTNIPEATLKAGYTYTVNVEVTADHVYANIGGEIENWDDGGSIGNGGAPVVEFAENFADGYIIYHNEKYTIAKMKDGNWWMTQNMRYVPKGKKASSDPADGSGLWYPATNATKTPITDAEPIAKLGLLYDAATAFGVDAITEANANTFEGCQGICPAGWHMPTNAELTGLVGHHSNSALINTSAPYYDSTIKGASIPALDADGFNWTCVGAVNRTNSGATGVYLVTSYGDIYGAMSYVLGSTFYQLTKNADDSIKNVQYHSFMSTINASNNKVTVAYGNYLSGASVRCVRDK